MTLVSQPFSGLSYSRIIISFTLGKWVMFLLFWNKCWKYRYVHCTIEYILYIINSEELEVQNQSLYYDMFNK
jgi:hypothetical protein